MVLSELEKLLAYINLYHNPERPDVYLELEEGWVRKMVVDIDCKMVLRKNWLPAGRVSVITLRVDTGEEKSFDVSGASFKSRHMKDIKKWLVGDESNDEE